MAGGPSRHLDQFAATAEAVAAEWGLSLSPALAATHSYVAPVGRTEVLKIIPPDDDESDGEGEALTFWNGHSAVRLLRTDGRRKALLLERAFPGYDLSGLTERDALDAAIATGRQLWRKPPQSASFPNVLDLCRRSLAALAPTEHEFLAHAQDALATIDLDHPILVHGDFHHHNVLRHGEGWVAIDPKPAIGEPEYDIPAFLWNPIGSDPTPDRTAERLAAFAAAGLDRDRMRAWAIVRGTILGLPTGDDRHQPQLKVVRSLLDRLVD